MHIARRVPTDRSVNTRFVHRAWPANLVKRREAPNSAAMAPGRLMAEERSNQLKSLRAQNKSRMPAKSERAFSRVPTSQRKPQCGHPCVRRVWETRNRPGDTTVVNMRDTTVEKYRNPNHGGASCHDRVGMTIPGTSRGHPQNNLHNHTAHDQSIPPLTRTLTIPFAQTHFVTRRTSELNAFAQLGNAARKLDLLALMRAKREEMSMMLKQAYQVAKRKANENPLHAPTLTLIAQALDSDRITGQRIMKMRHAAREELAHASTELLKFSEFNEWTSLTCSDEAQRAASISEAKKKSLHENEKGKEKAKGPLINRPIERERVVPIESEFNGADPFNVTGDRLKRVAWVQKTIALRARSALEGCDPGTFFPSAEVLVTETFRPFLDSFETNNAYRQRVDEDGRVGGVPGTMHDTNALAENDNTRTSLETQREIHSEVFGNDDVDDDVHRYPGTRKNRPDDDDPRCHSQSELLTTSQREALGEVLEEAMDARMLVSQAPVESIDNTSDAVPCTSSEENDTSEVQLETSEFLQHLGNTNAIKETQTQSEGEQ